MHSSTSDLSLSLLIVPSSIIVERLVFFSAIQLLAELQGSSRESAVLGVCLPLRERRESDENSLILPLKPGQRSYLGRLRSQEEGRRVTPAPLAAGMPRITHFLKSGESLVISRGDISKWQGDALVTCANEGLTGRKNCTLTFRHLEAKRQTHAKRFLTQAL